MLLVGSLQEGKLLLLARFGGCRWEAAVVLWLVAFIVRWRCVLFCFEEWCRCNRLFITCLSYVLVKWMLPRVAVALLSDDGKKKRDDRRADLPAAILDHL